MDNRFFSTVTEGLHRSVCLCLVLLYSLHTSSFAQVSSNKLRCLAYFYRNWQYGPPGYLGMEPRLFLKHPCDYKQRGESAVCGVNDCSHNVPLPVTCVSFAILQISVFVCYQAGSSSPQCVQSTSACTSHHTAKSLPIRESTSCLKHSLAFFNVAVITDGNATLNLQAGDLPADPSDYTFSVHLQTYPDPLDPPDPYNALVNLTVPADADGVYSCTASMATPQLPLQWYQTVGGSSHATARGMCLPYFVTLSQASVESWVSLLGCSFWWACAWWCAFVGGGRRGANSRHVTGNSSKWVVPLLWQEPQQPLYK